MVYEYLILRINRLLPGSDLRNFMLRRVVRILAIDGGSMSLDMLRAVYGGESPVLVEARRWNGIRWSGDLMTARLAPWVRQAIGLPVNPDEVLADTEPSHSLIDVRIALTGCRNISTVREALAYAYDAAIVSPTIHPRDCAGVDT